MPDARSTRHATSSVVRLQLVGANRAAEVSGLDPLPSQSHYFLGNDPVRWRTHISRYARVKYENIYPGIGLAFYGRPTLATGHELEFDFTVAPGADPRAIRLAFDGADHLALDSHGNLILQIERSQLVLLKPNVYQQNKAAQPVKHEARSTGHGPRVTGHEILIPGSYALDDKYEVSFDIGPYDRSRPLIIDPMVLRYSSYLGGSGDELGLGITLDASGNAYLTGATSSTDFPTTTPAQASLAGGFDAFVTKINPAGTAIVYSTYLGGSGFDQGLDIAVDAAGNAYLTGSTASTNFPTTSGAFDTSCGTDGNCNRDSTTMQVFSDAFVAKLNPAGSALVYSTYLGGSGDDQAFGVAVDAADSAYVTGSTASTNFPAVGPVQSANGGGIDAFVSKLNPAGSALVYSSFLGGSGGDVGFGIALDSAANAYLTGATTSTNFPTASAFQAAFGGLRDAFVSKLNPAGSALVYSTYLGGNDIENRFSGAIAVDASGNAYLAGSTASTNFPIASPLQPALGGATDAFVSKLNAVGSALVYSTYLGGSGDDDAFGIAVDASGNANLTGSTTSTNFPIASPLQPALVGPSDAFMTRLNPTGSALLFSTYLGGDTGSEQGLNIALDSAGDAYLSGTTTSTNFPTAGPIQATLRGGSEAFVAKIETPPATNPLPALNSLSPAGVTAGGPGFTLTVTGSNFIPASVARWNGSDRATTLLSPNQLRAFIPSTDIAAGAVVDVTVFNPPPRGGTSNVLTFAIADFALSVAPATTTVTAGQPATYTVTLTPQFSSFDNTVTLVCSVPLPTLTSCSFSPRTLIPGMNPMTSTLTVTTTAAAAALAPSDDAPVWALWLGIPVLLGLALAGTGRGRRRTAREFAFWLGLALLLAVVVVPSACVTPPRHRTPADTHTITITATAGAFQQSTTAELVVQ